MKLFRNQWIQLALILLATTVVYTNMLGNGFVIDDQYFIKNWNLTRSWSNVGKLLFGANPESQPGVYRPIRGVLYLVYYHLFGVNPTGYHLHSLLVHLSATMLVYAITFRFINSKSPKTPMVAALLFGLHPIHTESITYIAASMEMTGVVSMLASFFCYLMITDRQSSEKKHRYLLSFISITSAFLAYFTYEMTLTLPLLLLLYEYTLGYHIQHTHFERFRKILPYFLGVGGYFFVRFFLGVGLSRGDYLAFSPYHTWLTMTKMIIKYLQLLIVPITLSHNHIVVPGFEAFMTPYSNQTAILNQSIFDPEVLFSIVVMMILLYSAVILRKKYPLVTFSIGWFFITLLPILYIFPQGTAIAEKYLYMASFGWILILGWFLSFIRFHKIYVITIIVIALLYATRTMIRNRDWQSPITLWEHETIIHPQSSLAWYTLGVYYTESEQKEKAVEAYQQALILEPRFWQAQNNLKNLLQ